MHRSVQHCRAHWCSSDLVVPRYLDEGTNLSMSWIATSLHPFAAQFVQLLALRIWSREALLKSHCYSIYFPTISLAALCAMERATSKHPTMAPSWTFSVAPPFILYSRSARFSSRCTRIGPGMVNRANESLMQVMISSRASPNFC